MRRPLDRATFAWLFLLAATVLSSELAETHRGVSWAGLLVALIAVIKVDVIMQTFMEVRDAPIVWKVILRAWVLAAGCIAAGGLFRG